MERATALAAVVVAALLLAACGGGGGKSASPPTTSSRSNGGIVAVQPSRGLLAPAISVTTSGTTAAGQTGPLVPKGGLPSASGLAGVSGSAVCASTSANPSRSNLRAMAASIRCLLNAERARAGLPPLRANRRLGRAAKGWAVRMVRQRFFAHEAGRSSPLSRIRRTGYVHGNWQLGENLAWGSGALATPAAIVNGWMHGPPHRANILHGAFRDIGLGVRLGAPSRGLSGGAVYVTDFGRHS